MRRFLIVAMVLISFSFVSGPLSAQSRTDEAEIIRSVLQTERKAVVAANMDFTEAESQGFWPVYDEYQKGLRKIHEKTAILIMEYARNYQTMTDDKTDALLKDCLAVEKERLNLKRSFVKKFSKVLSPKKVARYYQIENKIEAIVKNELAKEIPLVQ
jgi:hypothetical protein